MNLEEIFTFPFGSNIHLFNWSIVADREFLGIIVESVQQDIHDEA